MPTKAFMFLTSLVKCFPTAILLLADFDQLPDAIPGMNAPVVQSKHQGKSSFHNTYLVPVGSADIFHPTDFRQLQNMFSHLTGVSGQVFTHKDFALRYGEVDKTRTMTGYNAMIQDYSNMSMFISKIHQGVRGRDGPQL